VGRPTGAVAATVWVGAGAQAASALRSAAAQPASALKRTLCGADIIDV